MVRILLPVAMGLLLSCAASIPSPPAYQTDRGQECGRTCQTQYTACMENEVRPDYLLMSPRQEACKKMLRECYDTCLDREKS